MSKNTQPFLSKLFKNSLKVYKDLRKKTLEISRVEKFVPKSQRTLIHELHELKLKGRKLSFLSQTFGHKFPAKY
jgi:hypothetical protein